VQYFSKCYAISSALNDKEAMQSAQVHYGIAQAHHQLLTFTNVIGDSTDAGIKKMIEWKDQRLLKDDIKTEDNEVLESGINTET
jgi:hypothetical protein